MEASDHVQQNAAAAPQADNFNRTELYNGMGAKSNDMGGKTNDMAAKPGDMGGKTNDMAAGANNTGAKTNDMSGGKKEPDSIDFSKAPDIYGGKGDSSAQPTGLSQGDHKKDAPGDVKAQGPSNTEAPHGRFGEPKEKAPTPDKTGVIKPSGDANDKSGTMTPEQLQDQTQRTGPQTDSSGPSDIKAAVPNNNPLPNDQVLSTQQNGKTTDVSSYSGADNQLTNYKLNDSGDVTSRATTDLNTNKTDTVTYGSDGHQTSRQVSEPGKPTQDMPTDPNEQVTSTVGQDGKVQSINTSTSDSSSKINLNDDGKPTSVDTYKDGQGSAATKTHETLDGNGRPTKTETTNINEQGRVQSEETNDGNKKTTVTYDDKHQPSRIDTSTPQGESSDTFGPQGTASAWAGNDGQTRSEVDRPDGSKYKQETAPHTTTTTETRPGGITRTTRTGDYQSSQRVDNPRTGEWELRSQNNQNGTIKRQSGDSGLGIQTTAEYPI